MASILRLRRGTQAECDAFTGTQGELILDTTNWQLRIHDGNTVGGYAISNIDSIQDTLDGYMTVANTQSLVNSRLGATATVALTGDVTASATAFSSNTVSITTTLADTGTATGTFGSSNKIPVITVNSKGQITNISNTTVAGVTATTYTQGNNVYRVSTADGKTFDTVIPTSDKLQVANAVATYQTIATSKAYLANTNAYIASVASTERAALANTNAYIANVKTIATNRLGETATVALTGDVTASATAFSSNSVSLTTTLADTGTATGVFGSSTNIPVITVNSKGQITSISNTTVAGVTGVTFTSANNNLRVSAADGTTFDTSINVSDKATWASLLATNTAIRSLVTSNDSDISNLQTEDGNLWSAITATNTAIRTLVSSNDTDISDLQTEDSNLWSSITATNTAIRTLVSDRLQVANSVPKTGGTFTGTVYAQHIIPTANVTYDLGSPTMAFRELYLAGSTITLGNIKLSTANGTLSIIDSQTNANVVIGTATGISVGQE